MLVLPFGAISSLEGISRWPQAKRSTLVTRVYLKLAAKVESTQMMLLFVDLTWIGSKWSMAIVGPVRSMHPIL